MKRSWTDPNLIGWRMDRIAWLMYQDAPIVDGEPTQRHLTYPEAQAKTAEEIRELMVDGVALPGVRQAPEVTA